jgi:hypothetical protein
MSAAVRQGIERCRAVDRYLEALVQHRVRRGPKRSPQRIRTRLAEIEAQLLTASTLTQVRLLQEQKNLRRELAREAGEAALVQLEADFVAHAKAVAERDGIEYSTWIAYGVPPAVLARAGITPTRGGRRRPVPTPRRGRHADSGREA